MLREVKGAWAVSCASCGVVTALDATSLETARAAATAAGWMDQARRGKGVASWTWLCPSCRPAQGDGMGRST